MKTKIFIDGSEGTTGLRIHERFAGRDDVEILPIASELRKDAGERKRLINESDITFLCLPDVAARESVSLIENENVRIIERHIVPKRDGPMDSRSCPVNSGIKFQKEKGLRFRAAMRPVLFP